MTLAAGVSFIDQMQEEEEAIGMLHQEIKGKERAKRATQEAMEELGLNRGHSITDIQEDCCVWEIHISGNMSWKKRKELEELIGKKLNCKDYVKVFAFCN